MTDNTALIEALDGAQGPDNKLDVLIECAFNDCRPNSAGTKVIYRNSGRDEVYWARDFTATPESRAKAIAALRARSAAK